MASLKNRVWTHSLGKLDCLRLCFSKLHVLEAVLLKAPRPWKIGSGHIHYIGKTKSLEDVLLKLHMYTSWSVAVWSLLQGGHSMLLIEVSFDPLQVTGTTRIVEQSVSCQLLCWLDCKFSCGPQAHYMYVAWNKTYWLKTDSWNSPTKNSMPLSANFSHHNVW